MLPQPSHPHKQNHPAKRRAGRAIRPVFSQDDLSQLSDIMKARCGWTNGLKDFQMNALRSLASGRDVMVHAGTGSGKTAIFAGLHMLPSAKGMVTLCASPLIALQDEQVKTMQDEFGIKATAINSAHGGCSDAALKAIVRGEYQMVFLSPEMMQSRRFISHVLQRPEFTQHILLLAVDEAHCVSQWGDSFRKKYGSLGIVRAFLPPSTPVVAVSATLTPRVRRDVLSKLQYGTDYTFIDVGNDRANVSLAVRKMKHPMNTYRDLGFVIPSAYTSWRNINKAFIYADSIEAGGEIIDFLTSELQPGDCQAGIIRPFNANHSHEFRGEVMEGFRKGNIRIVVCTDAAGMGCNLPNIELVVQWKLPRNLSSFVQRAGRAARTRGMKGLAVLLVEPLVYAKKKGPSATRTKASSKDAESEAMQAFVALKNATCRRKILADTFNTHLLASELLVGCCDVCEPELLCRTQPKVPAVSRKRRIGAKRGVAHLSVQQALYKWRDETHANHHAHALYNSTAILSDDLVNLLSSVGPIPSLTALAKTLPAEEWYWWDLHAQRLLDGLAVIDVPPFERLPPKNSKRKKDNGSIGDPQAISSQLSAPKRQRKGALPPIPLTLSTQPPSAAPTSANEHFSATRPSISHRPHSIPTPGTNPPHRPTVLPYSATTEVGSSQLQTPAISTTPQLPHIAQWTSYGQGETPTSHAYGQLANALANQQYQGRPILCQSPYPPYAYYYVMQPTIPPTPSYIIRPTATAPARQLSVTPGLCLGSASSASAPATHTVSRSNLASLGGPLLPTSAPGPGPSQDSSTEP